MQKADARGKTTVTKSNRTDKNGEAVVQSVPAMMQTLPEDAKGTRASAAPERAALRAIPTTFRDERDDVLAVINELEDQLDRYEEIRGGLERDLTQTNDQLTAARQRIQELEWQVGSLQTRLDAAEQTRQEVAVLESEIKDLTARTSKLTDQIGVVETQKAQLASELKTATRELEELWAIRKERDNLRSEQKALKIALDQSEQASREISEERNLLQSRLKDANGTIEEIRSSRTQIEVALRTADDRVEELQRIQEALEDKIEAARADKKALQAQLTKVDRENTRLREQQSHLETEVTTLRNLNRNTEAALSSVKKAFAEVRVALADTKTRARRRTVDTWPRGSAVVASVNGVDAEAIVTDPTVRTARARTTQHS